MKSQHILIFVLIALGAIIGSTLATISYLNNREVKPNSQGTLPVVPHNSSVEITSLSWVSFTPSEKNLPSNPKANDFLQVDGN